MLDLVFCVSECPQQFHNVTGCHFTVVLFWKKMAYVGNYHILCLIIVAVLWPVLSAGKCQQKEKQHEQNVYLIHLPIAEWNTLYFHLSEIKLPVMINVICWYLTDQDETITLTVVKRQQTSTSPIFQFSSNPGLLCLQTNMQSVQKLERLHDKLGLMENPVWQAGAGVWSVLNFPEVTVIE